MATFAENIFLMMTREEVAEVITYCKKNDISYKTRLAELGIPGERAIRPLALGRKIGSSAAMMPPHIAQR